jgi:hypothetical protein
MPCSKNMCEQAEATASDDSECEVVGAGCRHGLRKHHSPFEGGCCRDDELRRDRNRAAYQYPPFWEGRPLRAGEGLDMAKRKDERTAHAHSEKPKTSRKNCYGASFEKSKFVV